MIEKTKSALRLCSSLWIIAVWVAGVFYMEDHYFNLLEAKALFCDLAALLFVGVSVLFALFFLMEYSAKEIIAGWKRNLQLMDVAVFCFMLAAVISNLVTEYPEEALWGSYGWKVGTLWVVLLGLVYFFLSRNARVDRWILFVIGIATGLQFLLVIMNGFGLDPFSLHWNLAAKDYGRYVGTIGNTNWYVGYVTMCFPFFLLGTHKRGPVREKTACRILLLLASMTCITINSQGVYLGVGAVMAAYLCLCIADYNNILIAMRNLLVILAGVGMVSIGSKFFSLVDLDGFNLIFTRPMVLGCALAVCLVLYLGLILLKEERYCRNRVWIQRAYTVTVACLMLGLVILQIQSFNDSWGTNRGKTWKVAVQAFAGMPWINKLFGGGTNCFGFYYLAQTGSDWVRNAHNEYLEYLVTTGLFGALSYLGIYVSAFLSAFRNRAGKRTGDGKSQKDIGENGLYTACGLAILGYAIQAMVNNPQALNGAMFITILAIYRRTGQKMVE
ncbi:MAG: O-antigen ligase family protein [Lachnospiraceae bacterium]